MTCQPEKLTVCTALRRSSTEVTSLAVTEEHVQELEETSIPTPTPAPPAPNQPQPFAYAALFGVALLWGSYTPALRYLFLTDEPPSAPVMNALQACLPTPFLAVSGMVAYLARKPTGLATISLDDDDDIWNSIHLSSAHRSSMDRAPTRFAALPAAPALVIPRESEALGERLQEAQHATPAAAAAAAVAALPARFLQGCQQLLNWRSESLLFAGAELGLWMFLDFGLEVSGVQLISATKAAFLNQATVLITPILMHLSGDAVKRNDWLACCLALVGSILVAADGLISAGAEGGAAAQDNALGYAYTLLSAVFFAMSTVRLGRYSTQFSSINLASTSAFSLALLSLVWVLVAIQGRPDGVEETLVSIRSLMSEPTSMAVLLWCGIGPGALAAFLQAAGQQSVPPSQAQVIYAMTPLFSTGLAMVALDTSDEAMGAVAWVGAALMLGASLMASVGSRAD